MDVQPGRAGCPAAARPRGDSRLPAPTWTTPSPSWRSTTRARSPEAPRSFAPRWPAAVPRSPTWTPAMARPPDAKNGAAPGKAAPASISPAKALDASNLQPGRDAAGELQAWAAAVVHLHGLGLPAAVPPFPAAWL